MAITLESDAASYNQRVVIVSTTLVLIFSNGSYILRLLARRKQNQKLQLDDYLMGLALPFSYIPAICLLYGESKGFTWISKDPSKKPIYLGLTVGLGKHISDVVPKSDVEKFNIVWKTTLKCRKYS
jgi:hypothetical protein